MNELANQRQVLQKIDGWKVYHLSTQMESMVETEVEFAKKLNALHKASWMALSGSKLKNHAIFFESFQICGLKPECTEVLTPLKYAFHMVKAVLFCS